MNQVKKGIIALIAACVIWGIAPIYFKQMSHVDPAEMLSHRILWALVFFVIWQGMQQRLDILWAVLRNPRELVPIGIAALFITANWFLFIWAIQAERAVEASLGYYIFPLVAVLIGMVVFEERLNRLQWLAVFLAGGAVIVLSIGLGSTPWISLVLALTFGMYVSIKKRSAIGPITSVAAEVALLSPLALIWLWGVHMQGWQGLSDHPGGFFGSTWRDTVMLMLAGPITAVPLVLFSYGAQRVSMASVGLVQYLNPTLQFGVAVLVFQESFSTSHAVAFGLIWLALALYSGQAIHQERTKRRAAHSPSISP